MTEKNPLVAEVYDGLLQGVLRLLEEARKTSARSVNAIMTATYWEIGQRIVEREQEGRRRAGYGEAVRAWEAVRPPQPLTLDEKSGELVEFLFMYRGKRVAERYINETLIGILCNKAGIPRMDARSNITSHRARSTIASQLFNAKEPMSLFELQRWLGHKWAYSTEYYLRISATKLANSYRNAE